VVMTKKGGKRYRCYLPNEPTASKSEDEDLRTPPPHLGNYLSSIIGTCFYRLEGWWTYELCFSRSIRQFHQERTQPVIKPGQASGQGTEASALRSPAKLPKSIGSGEITQDYTLGTYWREPLDGKGRDVKEPMDDMETESYVSKASGPSLAQMADLRGEIAEEVASKQRYFRMSYGNGTSCDMTGKPRETEVRIFCGRPDEPSHIASIEEVSTCKYIIQFRSSLHCKHPAFEGETKKTDAMPIKCEPIDSAGLPLPATPKGLPPPASPDRHTNMDEVSRGAQGTGMSAASARGPKTGLFPPTAAGLGPPRDIAFEVGQCFLHRKYNYRGVILKADKRCEQSEAWMAAMHVDKLKFGRQQPFYYVLPDVRDRPGGLIAYVPQELLLLDTPSEPIQHPLTASAFERFDVKTGRFVLKATRSVDAVSSIDSKVEPNGVSSWDRDEL